MGIIAGGAMGLSSKYLLDKFWISAERSLGLAENLQKFDHYSLSRAFIVIFWGTESSVRTFWGPRVNAPLGGHYRIVGRIYGEVEVSNLSFHVSG